MLFAATLEAQPLSDVAGRLVGDIVAASELLSGQLEEMFRIARLDSGRCDMSLTEVALEGVLRRVMDSFLARAQARGLQLRHVATKRRVLADERSLVTLLDRLLEHALAVTVSGGIVIGCRAGGTGTVLEIRDSSPGLAPEQLAQVFSPGSSYCRRLPDHGLGLALACRLARAMGGSLNFDSHPERGNVVRLALPVA